MVLPPDVRAALVEALGAYLASSATLDLPKNLRRLQGFRPRALARHGDELLRLLEDETQRKLVLQALDDGELRTSKRNENLLRIALDRAEGWESQLAALSELSDEAKEHTGRDVEDELDRERRKTKDAREEARRAKASARAELARSARKVEELERNLATTRSELKKARAELETAATETNRTTGALERRERRALREAEKARAARDESRAESKSLRKEITRLTRELADANVASRPRRTPSVGRPREPATRTPMGVPKGLLAESRETLDLWLKEPHVSLLIDGYNVSKTAGGFGDLSLEHQRNRLVDEIDRLARMRRVPSTIVFDGALIEPVAVRRKRRTVVVAYSRPPEIADDHLVALLREHSNHPVIVVTNDRELQAKSVALGATIARAEQLLELIR